MHFGDKPESCGFAMCLIMDWLYLSFGRSSPHKKKKVILVGVVFLVGSMLKFGLFFLFINPDFKADGLVGRDELSLFFVPYLISLFSMTYAASRVLQRT